MLGHLIFWLMMAYGFTHYSYLRSMLSPVYKEYFHVLFLAFMVYLHYFLLIPYLFQRKKYASYWSITLILLLLLSAFELFLLSNKLHIIREDLGDDLFPHYLRSMLIVITFRNASFWMFSFIIRLYQELKESSTNKETAILERTHVIAVLVDDGKTIPLDINELAYIQCVRNKCRLYMKNKTVYEQYASLSHWEDLLVPHDAIRVNRDTLVMLHAVVSFTSDKLVLTPSGTNISIYKGNNKNEVFDFLCEHIPAKRMDTESKAKKEDVDGINGSINNNKKDEFEENGSLNFVNLEDFVSLVANDKDKISICQAIISIPSANVKTIAETVNIPYRTVARKLKYLKEMKVVQYVGAQKNGGYVLSPLVTEEVKNFLSLA